MNTKILLIALIKHEDKILFRKKPQGSPPYKETWYMFGAELDSDASDWKSQLLASIKAQTGINIIIEKTLGWDTEAKPDSAGENTFYIYLDCQCGYIDGQLKPQLGIEKLAWIPISELNNYDIVPPSIKLLTRQGYL